MTARTELRLWVEFEHLPEAGGELIAELVEGRVRITIVSNDPEHGFESVAALEPAQTRMLAAVLSILAAPPRC